MKSKIQILFPSVFLLCFAFIAFCSSKTIAEASNNYRLFPSHKALNVNPDTHLELTFATEPKLGTSGQIRIFDLKTKKLVDVLDLSIPAGPSAPTPSPDAIYTPVPYEYVSGHFTNANTKPGTPSGQASPTLDNYQLTIIGGFTDGFHFYPVIIRGTKAVIYLHNNLLEYNKSYYVQIDPGVLTLADNSFNGISGNDSWIFTTKKISPHPGTNRYVVSEDGKSDFNTVQGALDFIPDYNPTHVTIFIKNGIYEEIVYFRNKTNITILGENRDSVIVQYANNEVFNPHPINLKTNEVPGTFPSRRAAFTVDHCNRIHLVNMTIKTTLKGQAEGLLLNGEENIVSDVTIVGSGDALQTNGSAYYSNCKIIGDGDTILGRGPTYFINCEFNSFGTFMWIRNTNSNHGNVFVSCKFKTLGGRETEFARSPTNHGKDYPFCEAVIINCALSGISPVGWGQIGGETKDVHFWEYNSVNLSTGQPVDVSKRHPASKQLSMEKDADLISNYMNPSYILCGWNPAMAPIILSESKSIKALKGKMVKLSVKALAVPNAEYQWYKNGELIEGANECDLKIDNIKKSDAGDYSVLVKNSIGIEKSKKIRLTIH